MSSTIWCVCIPPTVGIVRPRHSVLVRRHLLSVGCMKSGDIQSEECENTSKDCSLISVLMSQSSQVMVVSEQP